MKSVTTSASFAALFLAAAAVLAPTAPATADGTRDKVLAIVGESAKAAGAESVAYGAVTGDDARFSVADTRATVAADGKSSTLVIATTTYTGAKPAADGGYSADEIALDGLSLTSADAKITVDHAVIQRYVGQAPERIRAHTTSGEQFERADLTGLSVTGEDGKRIPIAAIGFGARDWVAGVPRAATFEMKGLAVPVDKADESMKELVALGYDRILVDFAAGGTWDDKTGRAVIDRFDVAAADMGALKLTVVLGGLTPTTIAEMKKAEGDNARQMELLQSLTVERLALRWEDASLAGRIIAAQAKDQGVEAKDYVKQLKAMLPMVLSMVGNKDFEKKVATAAGGFLDAPKSLTVSATPTKPLPVSQIMGTAMMAPQSLPTVLGADVRAND
ncbi:hypothetical protein EYW49_07935 [Siculibacillus lacustris]|uniref:DUF945 family protein n=1 Tax=Siculibacillus lacustris TaxID=1549641 RepID=A0A4Q9VSP7_9HYPH|nr:hypothetical protein [Siculibacillus lacustris]TBW39051.1 hypothetical protein EYW49_07935 [Siculibacillus lacustris]